MSITSNDDFFIDSKYIVNGDVATTITGGTLFFAPYGLFSFQYQLTNTSTNVNGTINIEFSNNGVNWEIYDAAQTVVNATRQETILIQSPIPVAYVRFKFNRYSGGVGDTLNVQAVLRRP